MKTPGSGEFPFPLTGGPEESPYLTWLRNHSNYMAARGLFDYLRAGAVLGRGMIINFLIFLPYLLLVAIVLAYSHHWMREHPFRLTSLVFGCAVIWILLFPVLLPLFRIFAHSRSVETGSDSSVKQRSLYERSFGALLLATVALAALESLPWALEFVHDRIQLGQFSWQAGIATTSGGLALLGGSGRLLSILGGAKRQIAIVLIGILGLLVPLVVVLTVTDYLLYGLPPSRSLMYSPLVVPVVAVIAIPIAIAVGVRRKAFASKREIAAIVGVGVVGLMVGAAVIQLGNRAVIEAQKSSQDLFTAVQRARELADQFQRLSDRQKLAPEITALVDAFVQVSPTAIDPEHSFSLVSLADRLSAQDELSLKPLRDKLTELAHRTLIETIAQKEGADERVAELLQSRLIEDCAPASIDQASQTNPGSDEDLLRQVRARFTEAVAGCDLAIIDKAEQLLRGRSVTDIAVLMSEERLYKTVEDKFKDVSPGKAEIARLAGKEELARQLTTEEILTHLFPPESDPEARRAFLARIKRTILLEDALPSFPSKGAPGYENETIATARALALLAQSHPKAPVEDAELNLALFHGTPQSTARGADEETLQAEPTAEEIAKAAGEALARRALVDFDVDHLRALAFGLGRPEFHTVEANAATGTAVGPADPQNDPRSGDSIVYSLTDDAGGRFAIGVSDGVVTVADATLLSASRHTIIVRTTYQDGSAAERPFVIEVVDSDRLQAFLGVLETRPLEELIATAFPTSGEGGRVQRTPTDRSRDDRDRIWNLKPYELPDAYRDRLLLAGKAVGNEPGALARLAIRELIKRVLNAEETHSETEIIVEGFATHDPQLLDETHLAQLWTARFWVLNTTITDNLIAKLMFGVHGRLEKEGLSQLKSDVTKALLVPKVIFVSLLMVVIWLGCWLTVDVNLTSIHGLYRDRLASAFLVGKDTKGDIDIEDDIDLDDICCYEAGSTAPYHIVNVALNLQGSKDSSIRDRRSDFFIFSRRFIGGARTGYCRSETMEQVFPQMDLATAMAISAAAASPNMGRATSPFLVAFMTLLNIRLGFWVPNPGRLEGHDTARNRGFGFDEVFATELAEIEKRWGLVYADGSRRRVKNGKNDVPAVEHGLVGIGFSGGGIRSAVFNLGVSQALRQYGAFEHLDYMSTVSGGGYLGSSISTLMRSRAKSEITGTATIQTTTDQAVVVVEPSDNGEVQRSYRFPGDATLLVDDGQPITAGQPLVRPRAPWGRGDLAGTVIAVEHATNGASLVTVRAENTADYRTYPFSRFDTVMVKPGDTVTEGQYLIQHHETLSERFRWRVRPVAFLLEMLGKLDETHRWVNLSDGGHIENLAAIELVRRRCKYIIIGDGEADPNHHFNGLATLMRCASIDLGIEIKIDLDAIRLRKSKEDSESAVCGRHWTVGTITYPPTTADGAPEEGYLLYLKSSFTGDEGEMVREYRHREPLFPHQSTADQFFDEDQFEAYRALGQHVAEEALQVSGAGPRKKMSFSDFEAWFARLRDKTGPSF